MAQWLLNRLFEAKETSSPQFAFQGTVNWMRALSILVESNSFEVEEIKAHYDSVHRRKVNNKADTLVFENMMMAIHNQASLVRLSEDSTHPYDICRSAIINWYYSTYFTCSAMIAASSGSRQETHTHTAKVWHSDIVDAGLVMSPFSLKLSSLVEKDIETEIANYRKNNKFDLSIYPENAESAWGGLVSYLKGTGDYEKIKVEEKVRNSKEFKELKVTNFRTKAARELKDKQLAQNSVNYLVQAFRYRGKANYRDSIFLSYGYDNSEKIKVFVQDLEKVSRAFQHMASYYLFRRVEKGTWSNFINDVKENSRLSIKVHYLTF